MQNWDVFGSVKIQESELQNYQLLIRHLRLK